MRRNIYEIEILEARQTVSDILVALKEHRIVNLNYYKQLSDFLFVLNDMLRREQRTFIINF